MRKFMAVFIGLFVASLAFAQPATAATPEKDCKTGSYMITNRPDSGAAGNWALDTFKRTIEVCRLVPEVVAKTVEVQSWDYKIVGKDEGTFKTQGTKTPKGEDGGVEFAGRTGTMEGYWSLRFEAPANWAGWLGDTQTPNRNDKSTSEWIAALWSGEPNGFKPQEFKDWKWTYRLCQDKWKNWSSGNYGDITGKSKCPTSSPSPTPSVTTPAPTTAPPTTESPLPSISPTLVAGPQLPVTGAPTTLLFGLGALLFVAGVVGIVLARRRRQRFES